MSNTLRIQHLQALIAVDSGATDGERKAARQALEIHERKRAQASEGDPENVLRAEGVTLRRRVVAWPR